MKTRDWFAVLAVALLVMGIFLVQPRQVEAREPKILEFDTMAGLPNAYTGTKSPIRGVPGGLLPWAIAGAKGELTASGKLEIRVSGLVFDPNDPEVIARNLAGINTVPNFRAVVSCQTVNSDGIASVVNRNTPLFPASTAGNAVISTQVDLPQPCIAPIVFVTSPGGAWFAVTGQ